MINRWKHLVDAMFLAASNAYKKKSEAQFVIKFVAKPLIQRNPPLITHTCGLLLSKLV
jgi:hypothetical protein